MAQRQFDYERERRGALRGYSLHKSPIVSVDAIGFPFVSTECGATAGLGLALGYDQILFATSELAGRTLETQGLSGRGDLLYRWSVSRLSVTPRLGYRLRLFRVAGDVIPDVAYHAARAGIDAALTLGPVQIHAGGGARLILGFGEIGSSYWFPAVQGFAYDYDARFGLSVTDFLSIVLNARFEMVRLRLNAANQAIAPNGIADGAFDAYLSSTLGIRLELPGEAP